MTDEFVKVDEALPFKHNQKTVVNELITITEYKVISTYEFEDGNTDTETVDFDSITRCEDRDDVVDFHEVNEVYKRKE